MYTYMFYTIVFPLSHRPHIYLLPQISVAELLVAQMHPHINCILSYPSLPYPDLIYPTYPALSCCPPLSVCLVCLSCESLIWPISLPLSLCLSVIVDGVDGPPLCSPLGPYRDLFAPPAAGSGHHREEQGKWCRIKEIYAAHACHPIYYRMHIHTYIPLPAPRWRDMVPNLPAYITFGRCDFSSATIPPCSCPPPPPVPLWPSIAHRVVSLTHYY